MLGMLLQRFELGRPSELPAANQGDADHQARGPLHSGQAARTAAATRRPVVASSDRAAEPAAGVSSTAHHTPLLVLFGSNLGTAEGIATRIAQEGTERGFDVTLGSLDEYVDAAARRRRA